MGRQWNARKGGRERGKLLRKKKSKTTESELRSRVLPPRRGEWPLMEGRQLCSQELRVTWSSALTELRLHNSRQSEKARRPRRQHD